ncbi:hypothetical protein ATANTOWER_024424 [Ataeniobius toweri]|uniref:Fibronectin type-III domain-containing protein n=1 Tax=Ataeniobius toweri TaxID=208326 RepID=A0ABU7AHP2_9TELE|nr:hypothetical protein [Ataeniobius toweri]
MKTKEHSRQVRKEVVEKFNAELGSSPEHGKRMDNLWTYEDMEIWCCVFQSVCSSEPESIQAAPQNLSSLLVIWERPRAVYDANIEKYSITYRLANAEDSAWSEYLTDGYQDTGAILNDLLTNSTYDVRVVAICTNGLRGLVSDLLTVFMPIDDPGKSDRA